MCRLAAVSSKTAHHKNNVPWAGLIVKIPYVYTRLSDLKKHFLSPAKWGSVSVFTDEVYHTVRKKAGLMQAEKSTGRSAPHSCF